MWLGTSQIPSLVILTEVGAWRERGTGLWTEEEHEAVAEAGTRWLVQKLDMGPAVVWAAGWRVRKARFLGWLVSSGQC